MKDLTARPSRKVRQVVFPALPRHILVDALAEHGLPRRHAQEWMNSPQMVVSAQMFYFDTIEAANGDREARERVDYCRDQWQTLRKGEELLGNDPEKGAKKTMISLPKGIEL